MKRDIVITGSSGMLGFELLRHFSADSRFRATGVSRRGLPVPCEGLAAIAAPDPFAADWLSDDRRNATIVHCAGLSDPRRRFSGFSELATGEILPQVAFVERLLELGWRGHFVFLSSGGTVYGDTDRLPVPEDHPLRPKSFYGIHKTAIETALNFLSMHHDFRLTVLRVSNPYGSIITKKGQGVIPILIDTALSGERFTRIGSGDELRDYLFISDFCGAVEKAVTIGTEPTALTLNVGSGTGTSLNRLIGLVSDALERRIAIETRPASVDVRSSVLDIARARSVLGWAPLVPIEEGIAAVVAQRRALPGHGQGAALELHRPPA